jgi:hypothetical protein
MPPAQITPSTAIISAPGLTRCHAPNEADESPSAHHIPKTPESRRKIEPRKISSSTVPSNESANGSQAAAAVGPVNAGTRCEQHRHHDREERRAQCNTNGQVGCQPAFIREAVEREIKRRESARPIKRGHK